VIKKYIITISILLLVILVGKISEDTFLIKEKFILNVSILPKKINYKIPFLKQKIHIDISTTDLICKKYIEQGYIETRILENNIPINIFEMNKLSYGKTINIEIFTKKTLDSCQISLEVVDPYGNMGKTLISIILPAVLIFYLIFKLFWILVSRKFKSIRGDNNNPPSSNSLGVG